MTDLYLLAEQPAQEPVVVIADNAQRISTGAEPVDKGDALHDAIAAINDISHEDDPWQRSGRGGRDLWIEQRTMPEFFEQLGQLRIATVHIADHIALAQVRALVNAGMPREFLPVTTVTHPSAR